MPIYEFECKDCNHRFEALLRGTTVRDCTCPMCQSRDLRKLVSGGNFILKGSGWYADGYAKEES
jgi:putative FmdB family regulatory protein